MTDNTEKTAAPLDFTVSVRPIEPKGNLVGFASVCFADSFVVDDFKVLQNRAANLEAPAAEKPSIKEQLAEGAKQAAKEAAAKPAPAKTKKAAKEER